MTSIFNPFSRKRARAGPASFAARPPAAAGLTMAKKRSMESRCEPENPLPIYSVISKPALQRQHRGAAVQHREAFCQDVAFDLERSRTGKILVQQDDPVDTLVV